MRFNLKLNSGNYIYMKHTVTNFLMSRNLDAQKLTSNTHTEKHMKFRSNDQGKPPGWGKPFSSSGVALFSFENSEFYLHFPTSKKIQFSAIKLQLISSFPK